MAPDNDPEAFAHKVDGAVGTPQVPRDLTLWSVVRDRRTSAQSSDEIAHSTRLDGLVFARRLAMGVVDSRVGEWKPSVAPPGDHNTWAAAHRVGRTPVSVPSDGRHSLSHRPADGVRPWT
jgi:hypothetical protein